MDSKRKAGRPPKSAKAPKTHLTLRGEDYATWIKLTDRQRKVVRDGLSELLKLAAKSA